MTTTRTQAKTKKAYRELLNRTYSNADTARGILTGARTRAYGDWLYSADKIYFDAGYAHWLATGSLEW